MIYRDCFAARHLQAVFFLACFATPSLLLHAQTAAAPAGHTVSCQPDKSAPSEADRAFAKGQHARAVELYTTLLEKDPHAGKDRLHLIDSLLGQHKITDAAAKADEWTTKDAKDPWAITAAADVRFAQGDWPEAYIFYTRALQANACIPDAFEGRSRVEELSGLHRTSRQHLNLAHQLAPNDRNLRAEWIESLDTAQQLPLWKEFFEEDKSFDEKKRKAITRNLSRLEAMAEKQCTLASVSGPARIPMVPIYGPSGIDSYGLEVTLNGHKRTLQIDTGASGVLLTHSAATGVGLKKINTVYIGGFGDDGASGADFSSADTVKVGGLEFRNCPVEALSNFGVMGGSKEFGQKLDDTEGLIGTDLFDRYLVTVDYIKHEIRLEPLPQTANASPSSAPLDPLGGPTDPEWLNNVDRSIPSSMTSWTKVYRRGHMIILPTRLSGPNHPGAPRLFIADTGAESNIIDTAAAKEITTSHENSLITLQGLSGKTNKVFETDNFTLDFAGLRLPVTAMDAIDLSRFEGVSGFLGYPTLAQLVMHIDYRDNLVLFEAPKAKH